MVTGAAVREHARIPRDRQNDYTHEMAAKRREFIQSHTGADLSHVAQYSFDPAVLPGNVENFVGVAQVPLEPLAPHRHVHAVAS